MKWDHLLKQTNRENSYASKQINVDPLLMEKYLDIHPKPNYYVLSEWMNEWMSESMNVIDWIVRASALSSMCFSEKGYAEFLCLLFEIYSTQFWRNVFSAEEYARTAWSSSIQLKSAAMNRKTNFVVVLDVLWIL